MKPTPVRSNLLSIIWATEAEAASLTQYSPNWEPSDSECNALSHCTIRLLIARKAFVFLYILHVLNRPAKSNLLVYFCFPREN